MTGPKELLVSKNSAERISNHVRDVNHLPSSTNHRDLVRFDHIHDDRYNSVINSIMAVAADGAQALVAIETSGRQARGILHNVTEPVKHFVPRTDLEDQIKRQLHDSITSRQRSAKILVIHGIGGAGKSQLALGYVRTYRDDYSFIFVIDASGKSSVELHYVQVYRKLKDCPPGMPSEKVEVEDAVEFVNHWFNDRNERALFIFDSADNMDNDQDSDFFDVKRYLPSSPNLDIIITTRSKTAIDVTDLDPVDVGDLSSPEAIELFLRCSKTKNISNGVVAEVTMIVEELGYLALAIALAGAYVAAIPHIDVKDFLPRYHKERNKILGKEPNLNTHNYNKSVLTTWEMTHRAISAECPTAANMLCLLAFLNNEDIFLDLLCCDVDRLSGRPKEWGRSWKSIISPEEPLEHALDRIFEILARYSLVRWSKIHCNYSMHKLVHAWSRDRLSIRKQADFGMVALECLTTTNIHWSSDQALRARLVPHMMASFLTAKRWYVEKNDKGHVLNVITAVAETLKEAWSFEGEREVRKFIFQKAMDLNPADHTRLWTLAEDVADVQIGLNEPGEAEEIVRKVYREKEKMLSSEHSSSLESASFLAQILEQQGKLEEAEKLQEQTLARQEKEVGTDDILTLQCAERLATVLKKQGKYARAEGLNRRALEGFDKALGRDAPATLRSARGLAKILQYQEKFESAEELFAQAMYGYARAVPPDHLSILGSITDLARVLGAQGQYERAENLIRYELNEREKLYERTKPHDRMHLVTMLSCSNSLCLILSLQGKHGEAEQLQRRFVERAEKALGERHKATLTSVWYLAVIVKASGRIAEAIPLYSRAAEISKALFGSEHPQTLEYESYLRDLQRKYQDSREGLEIQQRLEQESFDQYYQSTEED